MEEIARQLIRVIRKLSDRGRRGLALTEILSSTGLDAHLVLECLKTFPGFTANQDDGVRLWYYNKPPEPREFLTPAVIASTPTNSADNLSGSLPAPTSPHPEPPKQHETTSKRDETTSEKQNSGPGTAEERFFKISPTAEAKELTEGEARRADYWVEIEWASNNLGNPRATPAKAPSNRAWHQLSLAMANPVQKAKFLDRVERMHARREKERKEQQKRSDDHRRLFTLLEAVELEFLKVSDATPAA